MQLCRPYIYVLLAISALILVVVDLTTRVDILTKAWLPEAVEIVKFAALWGLLSILERKLGRQPIWVYIGKLLCETLVLIFVVAVTLRLLDHATSAVILPLVDDTLASLDMMLGLQWMDYFEWIHTNAQWHDVLGWSYGAIEKATGATVLGLLLLQQGTRAKAFVEAFIICALISIAFGLIIPARGAADYWVTDFALYPNFSFPPGIYYVEALERLRQPEGAIVIGNSHLVGLVTFPSLHMATGVLFMLATMRTWLWVPGWVFSALMIAATPIWGGHYFVDLVGGGVMAIAVWYLVFRNLRAGAAAKAHFAAPAAVGVPIRVDAPA